MNISQFIHFPVDEHLGSFQFGDILHRHFKFLCMPFSAGYLPRFEIARSYGVHTLSILPKCIHQYTSPAVNWVVLNDFCLLRIISPAL